MTDEYCRALCELADDVLCAVSLVGAGDARRLATAVDQATARASLLSDRLLRAFCPSLPRTEAILLVEALHGCALTARHSALTLPPEAHRDPFRTSLRRLAAHLRQEIAALPRLLQGKRDALPSPRERAAMREESHRLQTRLCLPARRAEVGLDAWRCYDALLRALGEAEARYLALALECS